MTAASDATPTTSATLDLSAASNQTVVPLNVNSISYNIIVQPGLLDAFTLNDQKRI